MTAEPTGEDPAPFVDAIVGWRAWHLRRTPDGPALVPAASARGEWPARRAYVARCRRSDPTVQLFPEASGHVSPYLRCTCGIYASDTLRSLVDPLRRFPPLPVLGTVSLWGSVVEHRSGWRGGFAYPDRLRLVCGACLSAGEGSGVPVRVVEIRPPARGGAPRLEPLCAVHLADRSGSGTRILRRAEEVQGQLLSRYAVDLLPFEAIRSVFERTPAPGPRFGAAAERGAGTAPAPVTTAPTPTAPAPERSFQPSPPFRQRALDVAKQLASMAFTIVFWVVVAWWGCSDSIVTAEGP